MERFKVQRRVMLMGAKAWETVAHCDRLATAEQVQKFMRIDYGDEAETKIVRYHPQIVRKQPR